MLIGRAGWAARNFRPSYTVLQWCGCHSRNPCRLLRDARDSNGHNLFLFWAIFTDPGVRRQRSAAGRDGRMWGSVFIVAIVPQT